MDNDVSSYYKKIERMKESNILNYEKNEELWKKLKEFPEFSIKDKDIIVTLTILPKFQLSNAKTTEQRELILQKTLDTIERWREIQIKRKWYLTEVGEDAKLLFRRVFQLYINVNGGIIPRMTPPIGVEEHESLFNDVILLSDKYGVPYPDEYRVSSFNKRLIIERFRADKAFADRFKRIITPIAFSLVKKEKVIKEYQHKINELVRKYT